MERFDLVESRLTGIIALRPKGPGGISFQCRGTLRACFEGCVQVEFEPLHVVVFSAQGGVGPLREIAWIWVDGDGLGVCLNLQLFLQSFRQTNPLS